MIKIIVAVVKKNIFNMIIHVINWQSIYCTLNGLNSIQFSV